MIKDIIFIIIILVFIFFMIINTKIRIWSVITKQWNIFLNFRTKKHSCKDNITFYYFPIVVSFFLSFIYCTKIQNSMIDILITVYSILFSLLIGMISVLITYKKENSVDDEVRKETIITGISNVIISGVIIIVLLVFKSKIITCKIIIKILSFILYYCIIKSVLYILLMLKRFMVTIE